MFAGIARSAVAITIYCLKYSKDQLLIAN